MDEVAIVRRRPRIEACPTNPLIESTTGGKIKKRTKKDSEGGESLFHIEEERGKKV
jgi:hypothetical protein